MGWAPWVPVGCCRGMIEVETAEEQMFSEVVGDVHGPRFERPAGDLCETRRRWPLAAIHPGSEYSGRVFRWCRSVLRTAALAQPPATSLASLRLAEAKESVSQRSPLGRGRFNLCRVGSGWGGFPG